MTKQNLRCLIRGKNTQTWHITEKMLQHLLLQPIHTIYQLWSKHNVASAEAVGQSQVLPWWTWCSKKPAKASGETKAWRGKLHKYPLLCFPGLGNNLAIPRNSSGVRMNIWPCRALPVAPAQPTRSELCVFFPWTVQCLLRDETKSLRAVAAAYSAVALSITPDGRATNWP